MKILVPFKRVSDPDHANKIKVSADGSAVTSDGLEWKANPFDDYALEAALRLTENAKTNEKHGEVVVASLGPSETTTLIRQALATGADRGILVNADDRQLDAWVVAHALAALVDKEKPDLVLMGKQAVDGDSNATAQMLAERLGWPMATFAMSINTNDGGKTWTVGREVDTGVLTLQLKGPAVISVDLRITSPHAVTNGITPAEHVYNDGVRYAALKGIMAAKKKPLEELPLASLGVTVSPATRYVKFELPPQRKAGVVVENVSALVDKLITEAKVISPR